MCPEREVLETMRLASYRRERWWSTNYASSRELFWFSGVVQRLVYSCLSSCCSRAQQNGQKNQTDFGLLYPPSPRPSGRSPHRPLIFLVRSRRFLASEGEVRPLRDSPEASPSSPLRMIRSGLRSASAEDRRRSWAKGLLAGLGEKKKVEMKK